MGIIAAEDDYGKYGIKDFKDQVEEAGVCISFSETLPKVKPRIFHISANQMLSGIFFKNPCLNFR